MTAANFGLDTCKAHEIDARQGPGYTASMSRRRHPKKEIEAAVRYAEAHGWTCEPASGHAWGRLYCPHGERGGCVVSVWSTPNSVGNHSRRIRQRVDRCPH